MVGIQDRSVAPRVIALWAAPRSRSTALFRAMLEQGDLAALHEPFCNLVDFGETTVDGQTVRTAAALLVAIDRLSQRRTVFFKDTTDYRYPEVLADRRLLAGAQHTFLIRRPAEIAASYHALKPDMAVGDIGIEGLHEIYQAVVAAAGRPPVVLDSDDLVRSPESTLRAYCAAIGVPFHLGMLRWSPGERPEWHRSRRWHTGVSNSSGFTRQTTRYEQPAAVAATLAAYSAHHEPFYRFLYGRRTVAIS